MPRKKIKPPPTPEQWPAADVEMRETSKLTPYPGNPRQHSREQVEKLANAIREWGWTTPLLIDETGGLIAGHGRWLAARRIGLKQVPCMVARDWSPAQKQAYVIADNQLALASSWDDNQLRIELGELSLGGEIDTELLGFNSTELAELSLQVPQPEGFDEADTFTAKPETTVVTRPGDVWLLGLHRVACGDATDLECVKALLRGAKADVVHADPPYGMGKETAGVANDNLHRENLDQFQLQWLTVALEHAKPECSVYVWGTAPDLWRAWYCGGLAELDQLTLRNEIVWAKGTAIGQCTKDRHQFSPESERCLFLMRGEQLLGDMNKEDYWEGFEPLRLWLNEQLRLVGWTRADVKRITTTHMAGRWFGKSQFAVIPFTQYEKLQAEAMGLAFVMPYEELREVFETEHFNFHGRDMKANRRSYFDNTHEAMTDVWRFPRVTGDERYGHATPKPVAMIARALVTSCPEGGLVFEPFLGTGSTLIAADLFRRQCFGTELEPAYVDLVVRRWQEHSGKRATLEATGAGFDEVASIREVK